LAAVVSADPHFTRRAISPPSTLAATCGSLTLTATGVVVLFGMPSFFFQKSNSPAWNRKVRVTTAAVGFDCERKGSVSYIAPCGQTVRAEVRRPFAGRVRRAVWTNSQR
jgi:hypothetical protein